MTRWERVKYSMVRPDDDPDEQGSRSRDRPVEEIEADIGRSNDKERAIGLVAAPVAAVVGLVISSASINYARTHHQSATVYDELTYVLLGLAVLILVTSLAAQAPVPGDHAGALRSGGLPAALHLRGVRRPLRPGRCLVPGPRRTGCSRSSSGRRRPVAGAPSRPKGNASSGRIASPAEQALHAAHLIGSPASLPVSRRSSGSASCGACRRRAPTAPPGPAPTRQHQDRRSQDRRQDEHARRGVLRVDDGGR